MDVGDLFGAASDLNGLDDKLRAEFLLKGMELCGYSSMTLGNQEFRFGEPFLAQQLGATSLQIVSSNVVKTSDDSLYVPSHTTFERGGLSIGVIGAISELHASDLTEMTKHAGTQVVARPELNKITRAAEQLREVELTILLAHMGLGDARDLAEQLAPGLVDIVIAAEHREPLEPERIGDLLLVGSGYQGKWMNRIRLTVKEGVVIDHTWERVPLDATVPDDPQLTAHFFAYQDRLREEADNLAASLPQEPVPGGDAYEGAVDCQECHQPAFTFWQTTKHALALQTLTNANQDYDPSCLPCHTTGFGLEGGFLLPDRSAHLANVQCESCHGPGRQHGVDETPGFAPPAAEQCTVCHTPEKSPDFDLETYLLQVTCPGP